MVRCDEFYEKWRRCGNFCEKDPDTAAQIDAYLDQLQEIQEIAANCLSEEEFAAIAEMQISESACRPLVAEKDSEIRREAVRRIVKLAEQKVILGEKVAIIGKEGLQILDSIRQLRLKTDNLEMVCQRGRELASTHPVSREAGMTSGGRA